MIYSTGNIVVDVLVFLLVVAILIWAIKQFVH